MTKPPGEVAALGDLVNLISTMRRLSSNREPELLSREELEAVITAVESRGRRVDGGYSLDGRAPARRSGPDDWGLIPYISEDGFRRAKNLLTVMGGQAQQMPGGPGSKRPGAYEILIRLGERICLKAGKRPKTLRALLKKLYKAETGREINRTDPLMEQVLPHFDDWSPPKSEASNSAPRKAARSSQRKRR